MGNYNNPLVGSGWQNSPIPQTNPIQADDQGYNPGGYHNPKGPYEIQRNLGLENIKAAALKNQMAPQWAKLMGQYGQGAGNFFQQLMNFGSPFYRQKQQEAFTQGTQQNQNAAAMAQQRLRSQGYGATPSGANAAMIGGMEQQGAQNLSEQYLQNLFQNEQMQGAGAEGLSSLASLFNPNSLLTGTSAGTELTPHSTFFQNFKDTMAGIKASMPGPSGGGG
jgi:hypothetical protein